MTFIIENAGTIIVGGILLIVIVAILNNIRKKKSSSCCNSGCDGCTSGCAIPEMKKSLSEYNAQKEKANRIENEEHF